MRRGPDVVAVNVVPLEQYLVSVISSEMSASGSSGLLEAHAVTSRSWLLAQLSRPRVTGQVMHAEEREGLRIRWYDREEHDLYDVCADDHCQRYQGITRSFSAGVRSAVEKTRGRVLTHGGSVCDARFSKSCGGITEPFANVWEPKDVPYLVNLRDAPGGVDPSADVSSEADAVQWIGSSPAAFCNTSDKSILSHVLVGYDQETSDFYRWRVEYAQDELAALIRDKTGEDFGAIKDLVPVKRGPSGRIALLKIVGSKRVLTIGKELEIRRSLSPTHLLSSEFRVQTSEFVSNIPARVVLEGGGWGHGVGLCQIGAAVMGERGYSAESILRHYFPGTSLQTIY